MRTIRTARWMTIIIACCCGVLTWLAAHVAPRLSRPFDYLNYDLLLRHCGHEPAVDPRLLFLMIDDNTCRLLKDYPLKRSVHARLLRGLRMTRTERAVWDLIFDRSSPDDAELSAAMQQMPSLLPLGARIAGERAGAEEDHAARSAELVSRFGVGQSGQTGRDSVPEARLTLLPDPLILKAAQSAGHVAAVVDADGLCRRQTLLIRAGNLLLPSLGLAVAMEVLKVPPDDIVLNGDELVIGPRTMKPPIRIPTDGRCGMLVNYVRDWQESLEIRSYATQLQSIEEYPKEMTETLAGKTVIIGQVQSGGTDFVATPLDPAAPGIVVILNAANTILTRQFITSASGGLVELLTIGLPLLLGGFYMMRKPLVSGLAAVVIVLTLLIASPVLFWAKSCFLPISIPLFATVLTAIILTSRALLLEHARATHVASLLARFVSPTLLRELERHGADRQLSRAARVEVSVLFIDITGFTSFADKVAPERTSELLAAFYPMVMEELARYQGTLDKFLGDGVLAYFGAPDALPCKERSALQAALAIQERFGRISQALVDQGFDRLKVRCGITTDYVTMGYLGGQQHAAYTVVGRAVNLASRLQGIAEPGQIALDSHTATRVRDLVKLQEDTSPLKGFDKPVAVWRVLGKCGE